MRKFLPTILIALLTFAAFAPSLKNDFVNWDDPPYVIDNYTIRSLRPAAVANLFTTPQSSYYAPLVFFSFAVDFFFWELDPFGYHLTNVLLHILNALLVFFLLLKLSRSPAVALVAALLFSLNPMRAESVAWVTARKDVLSTFFYLAALIFYLRSRLAGSSPYSKTVIASHGYSPNIARPENSSPHPVIASHGYSPNIARPENFRAEAISNRPVADTSHRQTPGDIRRSLRSSVARDDSRLRKPTLSLYNHHYFLALSAAVLALLSKPMAITIFAVLWLFDLYLYRAGRSKKRPFSAALLLNKIPFLLPSLALAGVAFSLQRAAGTVRPAFYLHPSPHLLTAARNFIFYLYNSFFPANLSAYYAYPELIAFVRPGFILPVLLLATLAVILVYRARRDPDLLWGAGFFSLTVFPTLQLVPVGNVIFADRFSYLPSIGIFYVFALALTRLAVSLTSAPAGIARRSLWPRAVVPVTIAALVIGWGLLSRRQSRVWKDSITLWTDVLEKSPRVPTAHLNLGEALVKEGRLEEAIASFKRSQELDPTAVNVYSNLGDAYQKLDRFEEAEEEFLIALEIDPESAIVHNNLGMTYARQGRIEEAGEAFESALSLKPDYPEALNNLGLVYRTQGSVVEALEKFEQAVAINSLYRDGHHNLAATYNQLGDYPRAVHHYRRAIELNPNFAPAHTDLGFAYLRLNRFPEAVSAFEKADSLNPGLGLNYYGLALSHYFKGDNKRAAFYRDRAISYGYRQIPEEIMELK